jgi:hypothetical protein
MVGRAAARDLVVFTSAEGELLAHRIVTDTGRDNARPHWQLPWASR